VCIVIYLQCLEQFFLGTLSYTGSQGADAHSWFTTNIPNKWVPPGGNGNGGGGGGGTGGGNTCPPGQHEQICSAMLNRKIV
jgi:hypothetical protein